jgi:hypothetical protein
MNRYSGLLSKFVGVGALACGVAVAKATDTIEYIGPDAPSQDVTVSYIGNSQNFSVETDAGFLKFQVDSGNTGLTTPFEAVCGDVFHDISTNSKYGDTILTAPFAAGAVNPYTTTASVAAAGNIVGNKFDKVFNGTDGVNQVGNANEQAAGLQIAVWAAMYDSDATASSTAFDTMITSTGDFKVSGTAALDALTMADAYTDWQTRNTAPTGSDTTLFLKGGTIISGPYAGSQGQDQWTESSNYAPSGTPEPFTMGIGAAGIAFAIRRKLVRTK